MNKEIKTKIDAIKDFAEKMGYEAYIREYEGWKSGHPCIMVELRGTCDGEGEPYSWAYDLTTGYEAH